ncbi:MAG: hypothetical protein GX335_00570 [Firmicutes bacterium]|nr:hypothetical protein [Bacillota bacterium]
MGYNYHLVIVNGLKLAGQELRPREIAEVFFAQRVWLFSKTPSVERLRQNDRLLIYGSVGGRGTILGRCTLKTAPGPGTRPVSGLAAKLIKFMPLASAITDEVLWDTPKALGELIPKLSFLEKDEAAALYLSQGLRQLSKADYYSIVNAGEKGAMGSKEDAPLINYPKKRNVAATQDYENVLEVIKWLRGVNTAGLEQAAKMLQRFPALEGRLTELETAAQTARRSAEMLAEENQAQGQRLMQLVQSLEDQRRNEESYKKTISELRAKNAELTEEIKALRRQAFKEVSRVKTAMRRIIALLRGEPHGPPEAGGGENL